MRASIFLTAAAALAVNALPQVLPVECYIRCCDDVGSLDNPAIAAAVDTLGLTQPDTTYCMSFAVFLPHYLSVADARIYLSRFARVTWSMRWYDVLLY